MSLLLRKEENYYLLSVYQTIIYIYVISFVIHFSIFINNKLRVWEIQKLNYIQSLPFCKQFK